MDYPGNYMPDPNFERLLTVVRKEGEPDRIPFLEFWIDVEMMEAVLGKPLPRVRNVAGQAGSGEEFKFKQGDTAVFIFEESNLYNQENNKILRVENITNKDLVLKVLRDMNF